MRLLQHRTRFEQQPSNIKIQWLPAISVMIASMTPALPFITTAPLMPPLGFMLFLGWRLLQREIWPPWAGVALGLFDHMWSGQPLGAGMMLWSATQITITLVDQRMLWRDYAQDWMLAAWCINFYLSVELLIANHTGGHTLWFHIVPQILISILIQPLIMRISAHLDHWRFI